MMGELYIYLSNDNVELGGSQVEVFFDDFRVEHVKSPVVQVDDYYPFGLTFNSYSRENSVDQKYKFQGQEHINDLNLGWVSFRWRNHDPTIGRFFNVDPLAEKYYYNSVYAFSENKVTAHVELEGLESWYAADGSVVHGPLRNTQGLTPASSTAKPVGNIAKGLNAGLSGRYQVEPARGATVTGIRDTEAGRIKNGKPVGEWAVRIDKADPGTPSPHVNVNKKMAPPGFKDPHTKISGPTMNALEGAGKTLEVAGKIAKPVAIATDAVRLTDAVITDGGIGDETITTTGSIAGGWAGAGAGAWAGAKIGGGIGTFIEPGGGTAVGGFIGAIVGGIAGSFGGSWAGEQAAEKIIEQKK